ncbi:MAG: prolyl oligopeptidase family serine peptidase [Ignavibacteriales bacterium]|nr:prolyl oligopeptidase family serine peptidase [Ignavibacteriales bacterium]
MKYFFQAILLILCSMNLPAQSAAKKPLTHDVYDAWKKISGEQISNDGKWIAYNVEPQDGDPILVLFNTTTHRYDTLLRGFNAMFDRDSRYAVFSIKSFAADVKKAKIAKKKGDDLPKDSLGILSLSSMSIARVARVKSFVMPEKGSGWLAYQLEKEIVPADSSKKGKKKDISDADEADKDKKDDTGTTLVLRHLSSGKEYKFLFVNEFTVSKNGKRILFTSAGNDSTVTAGVFSFASGATAPDSSHLPIDTLARGKGKYKQLALDEEGRQAIFVADRDTSKAKQRFFSLYYWSEGKDSSLQAVDTATQGMKSRWTVSEFGKTSFSKDGKKIFFGTAPVPMPDDTTFNDEETAKLDVWNWLDARLQTEQVKSLENDKKRSYVAVFLQRKSRCVQLGDEDVPSVTLGDEGNADFALGVSSVPYRRAQTWEGEAYNDAYAINTLSGERTLAGRHVKGSPALSPLAQYIYWYNATDTCWYSYSIRKNKTYALTRAFTVPLYDELNDVPDDPGSYGSTGWSTDDRYFYVNDKYDIWQIDPMALQPPVNVTAGVGRRTQTTYRYVRLDPEERSINPERPSLLRTFSNGSKAAGFASLKIGEPTTPLQLLRVSATCGSVAKAKDDTVLMFFKSTFRECPDLYVTGKHFSSVQKISDANPQQQEYLWGTAELVHWFAADGRPLDGLLYKPENFDPSKKYPMIAYFYERNSDLLHRYTPPAPSASTVNVSLYVSQGYLVFIPDIRYRIGYPGQSAADCIIPGVLKLVSQGYVDSTRIGIQGQSWGGYQVAYLVSRTSLFRAGMAGAPVSNMTSAYGGIRWESGVNRAFQYEKQQSRIGATLWEKPMLYLENSALFRADFVTTPLLIMHNDGDGAVPWYQGIELFTALRRLDKPVWMLTYNGEEHNLVQRRNRKDLSIRMLQFFDHYLKDAPEPFWMTKGLPAIEKGKTLRYELEK